MFNSVIVVVESRACVVRGIDKNAFNPSEEFLFERFQCQEVVTKNEAVIKNIVVGDAMWSVIGFFWLFQQNTWFQLWPVLLANPGQFQFLPGVPRHFLVVPLGYHQDSIFYPTLVGVEHWHMSSP